ncbi:MAG: hypothetical protein ACREFG_08785, partial [Chthoniobacterales bacterium]
MSFEEEWTEVKPQIEEAYEQLREMQRGYPDPIHQLEWRSTAEQQYGRELKNQIRSALTPLLERDRDRLLGKLTRELFWPDEDIRAMLDLETQVMNDTDQHTLEQVK